MSQALHPIHHYAQNTIRAYHDSIIAHTVLYDNQVYASRFVATPFSNATHDPDFRVGIVGGGVGGLFAAMLLRHCGICYEILERAQDVGGRLYTHHFSDKENDYFDVGAMRFPRRPVMDDVFKLFCKIDIADRTIPYHFTVDENVLCFNGVKKTRKDPEIHQAVAFGIRTIPELYASVGLEELTRYLVKSFRDVLGRLVFIFLSKQPL